MSSESHDTLQPERRPGLVSATCAAAQPRVQANSAAHRRNWAITATLLILAVAGLVLIGRLRAPTVIPLAADGLNPGPAFLDGVYGPEQHPAGYTFRWTGERALVQLRGAFYAAPAYLAELRLRAEHPVTPQPLVLLVGGQPVASVTPETRFRTYRLLLGQGSGDGAELWLALQTPTFVAPENPRSLGVQLTDVALRPVTRPDLAGAAMAALGVLTLWGLLRAAGLASRDATALASMAGLGMAALALLNRPAALPFGWLIALALAGVLLAALAARPLAARLGLAAMALLITMAALIWPSWLSDDAFISFRYAQNLVQGHGLVYNPGERVEGYTNFLWTIMAAAVLRLGGDLVLWSHAAGVLIGLLIAMGTYVVAARLIDAAWALVAALIVATSQSLLLYTARGSGLETGLFTLLVLAGGGCYLAALRAAPAPGAFGLAGLLFALAALTRPEGVLVLGLTGLHLLCWLLCQGSEGSRTAACTTRSADTDGRSSALPTAGVPVPAPLSCRAQRGVVRPRGWKTPRGVYPEPGRRARGDKRRQPAQHTNDNHSTLGYRLLRPLSVVCQRRCHAERSEESSVLMTERPLASLGVTSSSSLPIKTPPTVVLSAIAYRLLPLCVLTGAFLIVYLPYFAWRLSYYGDLLPNTFYAKTGGGLHQVQRGLAYAGGFTLTLGGPLLLVILAPWLRGWRAALGSWRGYALLLTLVYSAYIIAVGGDHFRGERFFVPLIPWSAILLADGLATLLTAPRIAQQLVRPLLALGLAAGALAALVRTAPLDTTIRGLDESVWIWREIGWWMADHTPPEASIAVAGAGAIAFYGQRTTIDMYGLTDRHISRLAVASMGQGVAGHEKRDPAYILDQRRPDYIPRSWETYFGGAATLEPHYRLISIPTRSGRSLELWERRP